MMKHYKLVDKEPVECSLEEMALEFDNSEHRTVDRTELVDLDGKTVTVSTVFLAIDHNFMGEGRPILFETMIFGGRHDGWMRRYCTWDDAYRGHNNVVMQINLSEIHL